MTNSDWALKRYKFKDLWQFAKVRRNDVRAVDFLKAIQVVPYDIERIPAPDYINTNLDGNSIPAGYLAALAYEWDKDGASTAEEFLDSLRPEMRETEERENVRNIMEVTARELA